MSNTATSTSRRVFHDWTRDPLHPDIVLNPFQRFMREDVDWSKSTVGPMAKWPPSLRQMVLLIERDLVPSVLIWEEHAIIYNEAYTLLIGEKHPGLQGMDPYIGFSEIWIQDGFAGIMKDSASTGTAHVGKKHMLPLVRYGYPEEIYHSYRFVPVLGDDGYISGHYANPTDVTKEVLADRRACSAEHVDTMIALATNMSEFWPRFALALEPAEIDFPLVALYSSSQYSTSPSSPQSNRLTCLLEHAVGVSEDRLPSRLILPRSRRPLKSDTFNVEKLLESFFYQALDSSGPLFLTRDMLPDTFLKGMSWRGFGIPSLEFLIVPLRTHKGIVIGFMFAGLNPMKKFHQDNEYANHVKMITRKVAIPKASSILQAEEIRLGEERLILRSEELKRSEAKYRSFAEHAPIGVALVTADRSIGFANDAWFRITEQSRNDTTHRPWRRVVHDGDFPRFDAFVDDLLACKGLRTLEARLQKSWALGSEEGSTDSWVHSTWILASGYSELNADGTLGYAVIWITDISSQKAVERNLDARVRKALELKRQQENFVDSICHEIRNPASAMLHCAEEIASYQQDCLRATADTIGSSVTSLAAPSLLQVPEWLRSSLDAAQTIVKCVTHQRSIVDDVLTLRKLDSNLLSLSPVIVDPVKVVTDAIKLFEGEMRSAAIRWSMFRAASLKDLNAEWVLLDPGRTHQIIINLLTNAIKFTRNCEQREINVRLSAYKDRPTMSGLGVDYFPTSERRGRNSKYLVDDGHGSEIYLVIAVSDTGKGLSDEEKSRLFERFAQASPKTYTQYGGSGLGLWISREIVEMMDGEIGVVSEEGAGSTFTFFVKSQIATPSPDQASEKKPKSETISLLRRSASSLSSAPTPSNILVVEDNLVNQKVLCTALKKRSFNVLAANHGIEALETLYRTTTYSGSHASMMQWPPFDVILMDIEMPHMDGITCIRKIRELEAEGKLEGHQATIAVTANARPDHVKAALDAGMDGVTTKPYRMDDLVTQINKTFSQAQRRTGKAVVDDRRFSDDSTTANASKAG
ncbi:hypothetical protein FKW77_005719 [Venturia effusa]|uniref:histidine kinase n=1 Tax=Venturia effusa TaxID=50376 RepID=A0A517LP13_9PEZI|nr:hypothetical protein FKW77_005719 [Venturia effusa]